MSKRIRTAVNRMAAVLLLAAASAAAWPADGWGPEEQPRTPWQASTLGLLATARYVGWLPDWASWDDDYWVVPGTRAGEPVRYVCVLDRETGRRSVTWGSRDRQDRTIAGAWWLLESPRKISNSPADWQVCGWPWPEPGPVAAGEPAYWSLACAGACADGAIDWATTSQSANLAGATLPGERCGAAVSGPPEAGDGYTWHQLPRLHSDGGVIAITRCRSYDAD